MPDVVHCGRSLMEEVSSEGPPGARPGSPHGAVNTTLAFPVREMGALEGLCTHRQFQQLQSSLLSVLVYILQVLSDGQFLLPY